MLFSDYGKGGLTHIPRMIELARQLGKPVLIDPKGSDYSRYAGATVITPNRAELAQVVGAWATEAELHERAQRLREALGLDGLLLTRSEDGMSLFDEAGGTAALQVPAQAREVFDVTGAGDTVIATLAAMLACGLDAARGAAAGQPRRRHRGRQVRHGERRATRSCSMRVVVTARRVWLGMTCRAVASETRRRLMRSSSPARRVLSVPISCSG